MKSLGSVLKRARRDKKLKLNEIANDLKIRLKYLVEIEEGGNKGTPSVYKIGYIRAYAKYLNVDITPYLQGVNVESESKFSPVEETYLEQTKPPFLTIGLAIFCILLSIAVVAIYNIKSSSKVDVNITHGQMIKVNTAQLFINSDSIYFLENTVDNKALVAVVSKADVTVQIQNDQGKLLETKQLKAGESFSLPTVDKLTLTVSAPNSLEFYEFSPITMEKKELVAITR